MPKPGRKYSRITAKSSSLSPTLRFFKVFCICIFSLTYSFSPSPFLFALIYFPVTFNVLGLYDLGSFFFLQGNQNEREERRFVFCSIFNPSPSIPAHHCLSSLFTSPFTFYVSELYHVISSLSLH